MTSEYIINMSNATFQFIMKTPATISLCGGVLLALAGNPLGSASSPPRVFTGCLVTDPPGKNPISPSIENALKMKKKAGFYRSFYYFTFRFYFYV
jgi:hypothetical protein